MTVDKATVPLAGDDITCWRIMKAADHVDHLAVTAGTGFYVPLAAVLPDGSLGRIFGKDDPQTSVVESLPVIPVFTNQKGSLYVKTSSPYPS